MVCLILDRPNPSQPTWGCQAYHWGVLALREMVGGPVVPSKRTFSSWPSTGQIRRSTNTRVFLICSQRLKSESVYCVRPACAGSCSRREFPDPTTPSPSLSDGLKTPDAAAANVSLSHFHRVHGPAIGRHRRVSFRILIYPADGGRRPACRNCVSEENMNISRACGERGCLGPFQEQRVEGGVNHLGGGGSGSGVGSVTRGEGATLVGTQLRHRKRENLGGDLVAVGGSSFDGGGSAAM